MTLRRRTYNITKRRERDWRKSRMCLTPLGRLMRNVDMSGECWLWTGVPGRGGYGKWQGDSRNAHAHRAVWEAYRGPIPTGLFVLHHCDNPPCVRPDHLFLGTQRDNMRDMVAKGRGFPAYVVNAQRTHCRNGHEYPSMPRRDKGRRSCRVCLAARQERYSA